MLLKLLFAIDWIAALILLYFFGLGITDGSVAADAGLWFMLLAGFGAIIGGGHWLASSGKRLLAGLLLAILAAPAALYALFILAILITEPNWH